MAAVGTLIVINETKGYGLVDVSDIGRAIMDLKLISVEDREGLLAGSTVVGTVFTKFDPGEGKLKHSFTSIDSVEARVVLGRIKYWNQPKNFGKAEVLLEDDIVEVHLSGRVMNEAEIRATVGTPLFIKVERVVIKDTVSWTANTVCLNEEVVKLYRETIDQAKPAVAVATDAKPAAKLVDLGADAVLGVTKSYRQGKFGFVVVDDKDCFLPRLVAESSSVPMALLEEAGHAVMVTLRPVPKGHEVTAIALVKNEATAAATETLTAAPAHTGAAAEEAGSKKRRIKSRKPAAATTADVAAAPAASAEAEAEAEAPAGDIPNLVASASPAEAAGEGTLAAALKAAGVAPATEKAA